MKRTAKFCLLLQVLLIAAPVSTSVAAAVRAEESNFQRELLNRPSEIYQLGPGETTAIIAERLGLTLSQLRIYNQFRTFSKPFNILSNGDEIDIPSASFSGVAIKHNTSTSDNSSIGLETKIAGQSMIAADLVKSDDSKSAAANLARSKVTGAANEAIQKWLGQYGTVKTQISLDDEFSLQNSSIDWLLPLYETQDNLFYTQLGARNKDERNTVNVGLGVRYFTSNWMLGINSFYDEDLTGNNRRAGFGLEARTDYLQFAGNTYLRLSNWHQSRDFDDYNERPANGFDLRANAWLPAYPQLGGKLIYEQYYGDEVAIFGKDNRQSDPYAVTAGLNWTPFPLLTVGVDHKIGKARQNDTNVNVQLTWKPGESFDSQLSSDNVSATRLLENNMFDLVDRNNNIVLEYQKQELVKLRLSTSSINGSAGSTHPLSAQVNSKYDVKTVHWYADDLIAAGGEITIIDETHISVTLPAYKIEQQASSRAGEPASKPNMYTLNAVAEDINGNLSPRENVSITVMPPILSIDGDLTVTNDNAPADGVSTIGVTATIGDSNGHPVSQQQVTFTTTYSDSKTTEQTVITDISGMAHAEISSIVAGATVVTASAGTVSKNTTINFVGDDISSEHSTISISPSTIVADGKAHAVITLQARDEANNPVPEMVNKLSFQVTGVADTTTSKITESPVGSGNYIAEINGTTAGTAVITATLNGVTLDPLSATLVLTADSENLAPTLSSLTATPDTIPADGNTASQLQFTLKDVNGNAVSKQAVTFVSTLGTVGMVTENNGIYTAELTGTTPGEAIVTVQVGGSAFGTLSATVMLTMDISNLDPSRSALIATPDIIVANDEDTSQILLTLKDMNDNPVSGQPVTFITTLGTVNDLQDNNDGTYIATLKGTTAGTATVTVQIGNSNFGTLSANVELTGDPNTAEIAENNLTVPVNGMIADGASLNKVRAVVTDARGNPLPGITVAFSADNEAVLTTPSVITNEAGIAEATLHSTRVGDSNVIASLSAGTGNNQTVIVTFSATPPTALLIYRNGSVLAGNPVVGDVLTAIPQCASPPCGSPAAGYQWQVEDSPGSGTFRSITGATTEQYVVTTDTQRRKLQVAWQ